jgi:hypothetical protein
MKAGERGPARQEEASLACEERAQDSWSMSLGTRYARCMQSGPFDEEQFFRAIAESGARVLLIGRRALIVLGIPVLTADYDFWIHRDDALRLNEALQPMGLVANRSPTAAREVGRYVLENDERVDVLVARSVATIDGVQIAFDEIWARRQEIELFAGVSIALPSIDDLIATKRFGARPRDVDDVRLLQAFKAREEP